MTDRPMMHGPSFRERDYAKDFMVVPCGKCVPCTKVRQDNFACRVRAEAEAKGSLVFITLTYNDDCLPLVSTLWKIDKQTGEMIRLTSPDFVCYSRKSDFFDYRKDFVNLKPDSNPRYIDVDVFETDSEKLISRITPSVCRPDIHSWIKKCRYLLKKDGVSIDFTYAICQEYGPRTCRPHAHCCFFGLTKEYADKFAALWTFGFSKVQWVNRVNEDGSDGFGKVSEYIGKYVSKGKFECDSVKCGAAFSGRMMSSKGVGNSIVTQYADYVRCFDLVGKYDLDTFFSEDKKRKLSRLELSTLCSEIPKRLAISFNGKRYFALPRVIRNKIFYVKTISKAGNVSYCRPSKLWQMVVDVIHKQYADIHQAEFRQFLSSYSSGKIAEAVSNYENILANSANVAERSAESRLKVKYQSSKF